MMSNSWHSEKVRLPLKRYLEDAALTIQLENNDPSTTIFDAGVTHRFPLFSFTFVQYSDAKLWNSIPVELRSYKSASQFRAKLKVYFLSQYDDQDE